MRQHTKIVVIGGKGKPAVPNAQICWYEGRELHCRGQKASLAADLAGADLAIVITTSISHIAMQTAKQAAKRLQVPICFLPYAGAGAIRRCIEQMDNDRTAQCQSA